MKTYGIKPHGAMFVLPLLLLFLGVTGRAQSDTQPPQLVSLTIDTPSVDVSSALQTVRFTLRVTDNLSGLDLTSGNRISIFPRSPSGSQQVSGFPFQTGVTLDATFSINVTIPLFSEPGTWTVGTIRLRDNTGNTVFLSTSALAAAGFPTTFNVINVNPDTQAPQLAAISFSPSTVNVSSSGVNVTVDLHLVDNLSGMHLNPGTNLQDFELRSPSGKQSRHLSIRQFQLISGTNTNGLWRATLNMPQFSESGTWELVTLTLQDQVSNRRLYGAADLDVFGSSVELPVTTTASDTTPPQLTALSFTPALVNTSLGPQTVQIDMTITDDLAGVAFTGDTTFVSASFGAGLTSPSGSQRVSTSFSFAGTPPITGTPANGLWRFTVTFPRFSEEGSWSANLFLKDAVRNLAPYSKAELAARGFPSEVIVIRPSLQPDGSISDPVAGGSVSDSTFGTSATLTVPPGVLSAPTTIAIDVLASPLSVPLPTGFSSAETYFVNVDFTPQPTFPLPSPGITVVLPLRNYQIPGTAIALFRIDPATGNLTPAQDTSGNPVTGAVDPGGLTATFVGISRFSTVVGLLPQAISVEIDIRPGETSNIVNLKSKGKIPVAILSTPTFDATKADPTSLSLSGASVTEKKKNKKKNKLHFSIRDVNFDGLDDILVHFETEELLLSTTDTQAVVEGTTADGRLFRGIDSVSVKGQK